MSDALLDSAAEMLTRRLGFRLDGSSRGRLRRALRAGAESRGDDPARYLRRVEEDAGELQQLLDRLTVQETSFFRDPGHFDAFARHILPSLPDPVRIWSAACANGQEAYSLAMLLHEAGRKGWRIFATDISTAALARTREATYSLRELKGLSELRRARHLVGADGRFAVSPELRAGVEVKAHNLVLDAPPFAPGSCAVAFCRNVLIYLEPAAIDRFLSRLHDYLPPGGHVFLGASESLWGVNDRFGLVRLGGAFAYRRPADDETARVAPPAPAPRERPRRADAAPVPAPASRRPPAPAPVPALPGVPELLSEGERAASVGNHADAARCFRQAAYVEPDNVMAHVMLGLSLDALGEEAGAKRAFRVARSTIDRAPSESLETMLDGYRVDELVRLLDAHLEKAA